MSEKRGHPMRTVILIPDLEVGGYTVEVPSLPGCVTEGDTVEEALTNAREAIDLYIETRRDLGLEIPAEDSAPILVTAI
jgi:antitoxin HicB